MTLLPSSFGTLDAILKEPRARWHGCASELNAGYAADGCARITRTLSVLVTTYGVGELSAINAVAGAYCERVPIVCLTSSPTADDRAKSHIMHHTLMHKESGFDVFAHMHRPVTCAQAHLTVDNASSEVERVLTELFRTSTPAYINLPFDIGYAPSSASSSAGAISKAVPQPPSDPARLKAAVQAVTAAVDAAARPAILADLGVLRANCSAQLAQLASSANLPVATLVMGRGCLSEQHPNHIGVYQGKISYPPAVTGVVERADCVLSLGANLTDWSTGGFTAHLEPSVMIEVKLNATTVKGEVFENVRERDIIAALASALRPRSRKESDAYWSRRPPFPEDGLLPIPPPTPCGELTTDLVLATLQRELRKGDVLVLETCTASFGLSNMRIPEGVDVISQQVWGSIGFACPAAGGAAVAVAADPSRRVFLLTGDGSLQMTAPHVGTMLRDGCAVVMLVLNNGGYLIEKLLARRLTASYNDIALWNFPLLPAAMGGTAESFFAASVKTGGEMASVWKEAMGAQAGGKLCLLDLVTDPLDVSSGAKHLVPARFDGDE